MNIFTYRCLPLLSIFLMTFSWGHAQLTTTTLSSTQDSYIDTRYPSTNYGNNTSMTSSTYLVGSRSPVQYYRRSFVEFDVSSIPSNAVIYSASLDITRTGTVTGGASWNTKLVTSSWVEGDISSEDQPGISELAADLVSTTPSTISYVDNIDVTSMVQRMVYGQTTNYGWSIQVSNEGYSGTSGASIYTNEYSTSSYRPKLVVQYYTPLSLNTVTVSHESATSEADGGVSFTLSGGASSSYTYTWINGSTGSQISSSSSSTPVGLSDQSYGWYGLHVTGTYGEELYQAFIVGTDCEEVTITFQPDRYYTSNAILYDRTGFQDANYGDYSKFRSDNNYSTFNIYSVLGFNLWMDDAFEVNQADMTLYGWIHHNTVGTNECNLTKVTEDWEESTVTFNSMPSSVSSPSQSIPATTSSAQNNTVDLIAFWEDWKSDNSTNYGMLFELQTLNTAHSKRQGYYSPADATVSSRPSIEFKVDLSPSETTVVWDDNTETGSVAIDITCLANTAPYFYLMSVDTIPGLDSLYLAFTDTITGPGIDSLSFYGMATNDLQKTFNISSAGHYHFSVFDVLGNRILDKAYDLQNEFVFDQQTGLSSIDSEITASQTNSVGSVQLHTHQDLYSSFKIQLTGTIGDQFFGFTNANTTVANYSNMEYGFYLTGRSLYVVDAGVLSSTSMLVENTSLIELINDKGELKLMVDGNLHDTRIEESDFTYKIGIGMQPANKVGLFPIKFILDKQYHIFSTDKYSQYFCGSPDGILNFTFERLGSTEQCPIVYSVVNPNGVTIVSAATATATNSIEITSYNGNPLIPGYYTISGTMSCTGQSIPFVESYFLGYEPNWAHLSDYTISPDNSTIERDDENLWYAMARANNVLADGEEGMIEFTPTSDNGSHYMRFTTLNLNQLPNSNLSNESYIGTMTFLGLTQMVIYSPGYPLWFEPVSDNPKIKLVFTVDANFDKIVNVFVNDVFVYYIPRADGMNLARFNTKTVGDGFEDIRMTFGCPESTDDIYAHLEYDLDGYYHIMKDGLIKFIYDQEYDADDLKFKIFNYKDDLHRTEADFAPIATTNGDNYLTIDVTDLDCIGRGFFYLEVTNSKKEKLYLRFFNDYTISGCVDTTADPNQNEDQ